MEKMDDGCFDQPARKERNRERKKERIAREREERMRKYNQSLL